MILHMLIWFSESVYLFIARQKINWNFLFRGLETVMNRGWYFCHVNYVIVSLSAKMTSETLFLFLFLLSKNRLRLTGGHLTQQLELTFGMPASHSRHLGWVLAVWLLIQLMYSLGSAGNGCSTWVPATRVGDPDEFQALDLSLHSPGYCKWISVWKISVSLWLSNRMKITMLKKKT